ncbi:SGNH/GDSL hydrolase family protein [Pseudomonas sp. F8002]|uniref:SGNH/GDSL hydrolase family protein n=1 Tax=Pseudomonas sp. F8002 TaxID=2738822 RepID=UPI0015A3FA16|nr:SGNH/GDSL hydrolase family protein [Pseudomonas sp. F8002]NWB51889.1 SGNH/GDSL hydrolase family protein [Pseudomonas sp. F8002]
MQPIQFFAARAEDGALLPGATVDVFVHGTQQRAVLFSDSAGNVPLGNPAYADASARVLFYSSTDRIDIRLSRYGYVAPLLVDISTVDVATAVEQVRAEIQRAIDEAGESMDQMEREFAEFLLKSGFESIYLAYGAGVVVQRATQLVQRNGELYRVINQSALPLTLTGTWATDAPKLFAVGDAGLRGALYSSAGTTYIKRGAVELEQSLVQIESSVSVVSSRAEVGVLGDRLMRLRVRAATFDDASIIFLGDSNMHGAASLDAYRNSHVNLLKRMINADLGLMSYGFTPLMSMGIGTPTATQDVHDIAFTRVDAAAHSWSPREGATGSYVVQGLSWVSQQAGNILSSTIPTFQRKVWVWYIGNPGGGTFDVKINGVVAASVNTAAASVTLMNVQVVEITDNGMGQCKIECVTTSAGKVELCGFSYNAYVNSLTVNNFSNSGRRLRWLDELAINAMLMRCSCLVMGLGLNDMGDNKTNPEYFAAFKQRIDWLILYAKFYEVPVVVPDYLWSADGADITRRELQRLAKETGGVYIPFPDMFQKSGLPTTDDYRVNTLKLFSDGYHWNVAGHKYAAESIAKWMGLSCTSKKIALDQYDWWYPIRFGSTGVTNIGTNSDTVSAVRNAGSNRADLRMSVSGITLNTQRTLWAGWPSRAGILQAYSMTNQLMPKTDGTSRGTYVVLAGGAATANPNSFNDVSQHTVFMSFPTSDHGA